jgi:branched-chain amino acid transport system ATP-binding protein
LCVRRLIGPSVHDADGLAAYVQLDHVIDSLAGQLSWGQTRLLGIGLALALEPTLLLLDEPFAGLSPVAAEQIGMILRRLKESGIAMAIIDHEMTYLLPVIDRLIVLVNGRKLAEGTPDEVIALAEVREAYLGL